MRHGPITIPNVAGPVTVEIDPWLGRTSVQVAGKPAKPTGRRTFALPTVDGLEVPGTVRSAVGNPFPSVEVEGVTHATGPDIPVGLKILAFLPLVLLGFGGLVGGAAGFLGVLDNARILRARKSTATTAALMTGSLAASVLVWLLAAAIIVRVSGGS